MAKIAWVPLDLWRASKLQTETREVQAVWAEAVESGDEGLVRELKSAIEARIDELENFYVRHASDQRAVLFEKQRLSLRALLQTYGAARRGVATASPTSRVVDGSTAVAWDAEAVREEVAAPSLTDDSRLGLAEFRAWFDIEGKRQVPGLPSKHLDEVFETVSIASEKRDGKMSVRELRRWFFTVFRKGGWKPGTLPSSPATASKKSRIPIYAFEAKAMASRSSGAITASSPAAVKALSPEDPVGLPGSSLAFDVVLTPEEYAALSLRRRAMEAEDKDRRRRRIGREMAEAAKQAKVSRGGLFTPDLSKDALLKDSTFVDQDKMERFIFRHSKPRHWVAKDDFKTR